MYGRFTQQLIWRQIHDLCNLKLSRLCCAPPGFNDLLSASSY